MRALAGDTGQWLGAALLYGQGPPTPSDHQKDWVDDFIAGSKYNANSVSADEYLCTGFDEPYNDVRAMMFLHNHIMLVLRARLVKATWD